MSKPTQILENGPDQGRHHSHIATFIELLKDFTATSQLLSSAKIHECPAWCV
jgi:hypothetical protein